MGLNASVMCACYSKGLIPRPAFAHHLIVDEDGYLNLDLPFDGNEALYEQFDVWVQSACSHPGIQYAFVSVGTWAAYRSFMQALADLGWQRFPVLRQQLPQANGGLTPAEAARAMVQELDLFCRQPPFGIKYVLVDSGSGQVLQESIAAHEGKFIYSGPDALEIGLDEAGIFILHQDLLGHRHEVFRSTAFEQIVLEPNRTERHEPGRVRYKDLASGTLFECLTAIPGRTIPWPDGKTQNDKGQVRFEYPTKMVTEHRDRSPQDYVGIIEPLRTICKASIETGNPIRWC